LLFVKILLIANRPHDKIHAMLSKHAVMLSDFEGAQSPVEGMPTSPDHLATLPRGWVTWLATTHQYEMVGQGRQTFLFGAYFSRHCLFWFISHVVEVCNARIATVSDIVANKNLATDAED